MGEKRRGIPGIGRLTRDNWIGLAYLGAAVVVGAVLYWW